MINRRAKMIQKPSKALPIIIVILVIALVTSPGSKRLLASFTDAAFASQAKPSGREPVRRALLVGIGGYDRAKGKIPSGRAGAAASASAKAFLAPLPAPPNDVKDLAALLKARYRFEFVHILPEAEATHDGILNAIQKYLIDDAAPGDECLFYFSGHGSYIRNSKSDQPNKQDETIVPIDYVRPIRKKEDVKDIRDREFVQYFNRAIDKGIVLTAIFDSCHSGSIVRGEHALNAKAAPGSDFDLAEATLSMPKPAVRGALILSAALAHQQAMINEYGGVPYSDFTYHLIKVLSSQSAEALTAEQLFQQVAARLKGSGKEAEPVLDTNKDRRKMNLFGSPVAAEMNRLSFVASKLDREKKDVVLDRGRAYGITAGSVLVKQGGAEPKVRLEVTEVSDLTSSRAKPLAAADLAKIKPGDVFELETWAASPESLSVWIPGAVLPLAEIKKAARELAALRKSDRVRLVDDPTEAVATHVLYFDGGSWKLGLPSGAVIDLGPLPKAEEVMAKSGATRESKADLFIRLPLPAELKERIRLGPGAAKSAVTLAPSERLATYKLIGHFLGEGEEIEYAWVLVGAFKTETETERNARLLKAPTSSRRPMPLPPITNWASIGGSEESWSRAARELEDLALALNKIYGWVNLKPPSGLTTADETFPFRLAVFDRSGKEIDPFADPNARLIEGEKYQVALAPDQTAIRSGKVKQRWVYVLTIDKNGTSYLVYPRGDTGISNQFPRDVSNISQWKTEILEDNVEIAGPSEGGVLGPETYILLATDTKLSDPFSLEFKGVKTDSIGRGGSELEMLLNGIGITTRSGATQTPAAWSVQHLFLESKPK